MALTPILQQQVRAPDTYFSNEFTVPSGPDIYRVVLDLNNDADFADPSQKITIIGQTSSDGGQNWKNEFSATWEGGPAPDRHGNVWSAAVSGISAYVGLLVRAQVTSVGGTWRWGLRGELRN